MQICVISWIVLFVIGKNEGFVLARLLAVSYNNPQPTQSVVNQASVRLPRKPFPAEAY